jgi:hypothetical protein
MMRRSLVILLLMGLPGVSLGQQGVDKYFAPGSQFYFHFDGIDAQREAFDKTATGKMLKGETGKFVNNLWTYLNENIEPLMVKAEVDPDLIALVKELPGVVESLYKHGFAMAIEARQFNPPEVQAVFVFPGSGGPKGKLSSIVKKTLKIGQVETTTIRDKGMEMQRISNIPPLEVAFGSDGDNALLVVGNVDPADVMRRRNDKGNNIAKNPLHMDLKKFKEFAPLSQGFLDVGGLLKSASALAPPIAKVIDETGLNGLTSITFHSGFDGPAERSVTDFNMPGPRKRLLALTKTTKFSLSDLPPLPHDILGFSAASLDATAAYDTLIQVGEGSVRVFNPDIADNVKETIKQAEGLIGVNLRDGLLSSLGNMTVSYNSPSESPLLGLGSVTLFKVKDEKKLIEAAQSILKNFPPVPAAELVAKVRKYHGVDVVDVELGPVTATFAIHKGWLIWSNYPQPVHGYILRAQGDLPTWKADARTEKALAAFPKEFNSFSMSDPAPLLQSVLAVAPPVLSAMNSASKQFLPAIKPFDVSSVPHPLEATRFLFPNITIRTDNGKRVRIETRSSFPSPF